MTSYIQMQCDCIANGSSAGSELCVMLAACDNTIMRRIIHPAANRRPRMVLSARCSVCREEELLRGSHWLRTRWEAWLS